MVDVDTTVMDFLKDGWFSEKNSLWPGQYISLEVDQLLHHEKSNYQDIVVLKTKKHGTALILDGIIQCTEHDEFSYQEMISMLPLCAHPNPERVLIVGGGDGGVAREVSKHPSVKQIHQVEIDDRVVELSKKYLPSMAVGFSSPKLTLHIGDGFEFMKNHKNEFDVVITDSSDPVGPNKSLFQDNYFLLLNEALRDGGIICSQASTIWIDLSQIKAFMETCQKRFAVVKYAVTSVPTYPTGQIGFVIAAKNQDTDLTDPKTTFTEKQSDDIGLRYYSTEIHKAAFVLPKFVQKQLQN